MNPENAIMEQLRKKIVDIKVNEMGCYTETFNIVSVISKTLADVPEIIREKLSSIYKKPSQRYNMTLPQLEQLWFKYKEDPNLNIKSKKKIDIYDVKDILDRTRRDLLFILIMLENPKKDYNIQLEQNNTEAGKPSSSLPENEKGFNKVSDKGNTKRENLAF